MIQPEGYFKVDFSVGVCSIEESVGVCAKRVIKFANCLADAMFQAYNRKTNTFIEIERALKYA